MDSKGKYDSHICNRISACRRAIYRMSSCGMSYPGLHANVKSYLWKSVGAPTLLYGSECIPMSSNNIKDISSTQGTIIKNVMGISKRSHHTNLLQALGIDKADNIVIQNSINFYNRLFKVDSPLLGLQCKFLSHYLETGKLISGTLIHKIVNYGFAPLDIIARQDKFRKSSQREDNGIVHSLRHLIFNDNYIKPWSDEYFLTKLLTRAF